MPEPDWTTLPPAAEIEKWNSLHPGLGVRAFSMVERQQRHEHRVRWVSIISSTLMAGGSLIAAVYFMAQGNTAGGAALPLSSTGGIVTTYLTRLLPDRSASNTPAPAPAASPAASSP
ncbi:MULTISPECIES: DUF2335 domain-containing protein [unclassified Streptomyces]|uniref:DUF2335 domain-containing protein n=1 Tax=unclassified Streptomyces TaxID=2593676 RepID=UPI0033A80AE7